MGINIHSFTTCEDFSLTHSVAKNYATWENTASRMKCFFARPIIAISMPLTAAIDVVAHAAMALIKIPVVVIIGMPWTIVAKVFNTRTPPSDIKITSVFVHIYAVVHGVLCGITLPIIVLLNSDKGSRLSSRSQQSLLDAVIERNATELRRLREAHEIQAQTGGSNQTAPAETSCDDSSSSNPNSSTITSSSSQEETEQFPTQTVSPPPPPPPPPPLPQVILTRSRTPSPPLRDSSSPIASSSSDTNVEEGVLLEQILSVLNTLEEKRNAQILKTINSEITQELLVARPTLTPDENRNFKKMFFEIVTPKKLKEKLTEYSDFYSDFLEDKLITEEGKTIIESLTLSNIMKWIGNDITMIDILESIEQATNAEVRDLNKIKLFQYTNMCIAEFERKYEEVRPAQASSSTQVPNADYRYRQRLENQAKEIAEKQRIQRVRTAIPINIESLRNANTITKTSISGLLSRYDYIKETLFPSSVNLVDDWIEYLDDYMKSDANDAELNRFIQEVNNACIEQRPELRAYVQASTKNP